MRRTKGGKNRPRVNPSTGLSLFPLVNDAAPRSGGKPPLAERTEQYRPFAERLATIVRSYRNIKVTATKIKMWANDIRRLVEADGVHPTRVNAALDWYAKHAKGQYVPVIESGAALRDKFHRLEAAIERDRPRNNAVTVATATLSARRIIMDHFGKGDFHGIFYRECYQPAQALLQLEDKAAQAELANKLIGLHRQIDGAQAKHLTPDLRSLLAGSVSIIASYIVWLRDGWVDTPRANMFDVEAKVFATFRRDQAKTDNFERDPLTGRSYMRD